MRISLSFADRRKLQEMAIRRRREAFRPGTVANQHSLALLYVAFTLYFRFVDLPASERTLLFFAEFLLCSFAATKSVTNALSAVKRLHMDLGFSTVAFDAPAVERWKRALCTMVRWVPRQAPPLQLEVLQRLLSATHSMGVSGGEVRALFTLLFHSMTWLSSLLPLSETSFDNTRHACRGDFARRGSHWWFRVKLAKAHQRAEQGYWVPILPRPGSQACPVAALRAWLGERGRQNPQDPFFTVPSGRPLAIPMARFWLRRLLTHIGKSSTGFTLHSLRRGACTAAFANGAQTGNLKALGGWRSEAVELYRSPEDARLRAARALLN